MRHKAIDDTARRILKEQTGLENIFAKHFYVFSNPDRLNRRPQDFEWVKLRLLDERVLTVGFYSLVNLNDIDNSMLLEEASWMNVGVVTELMFDHNEIFNAA